MLDRMVVYDIPETLGLTCGRRGKNSSHKLQLGGSGIQKDHAKFKRTLEGQVRVTALSPEAIPFIKINGKPLESLEGQILRPNDRICIGPSAYFIFKNKANEHNASMPDPSSDPISFEFANEEVVNYESQGLREQ